VYVHSLDPTGLDALRVNSANEPDASNFVIEKFADVIYARSMVLAQDISVLFVASFNFGGIDSKHSKHDFPVTAIVLDGINNVIKKVNVTESLEFANGVAYFKGSLYVGLIDRILKYDNVESVKQDNFTPLQPSAIIVGNGTLPNSSWHGWRYMRFHKEKLYFAVGSPCNIPSDDKDCLNTTKYYGTIIRMDPDGKNIEIYASGIRNSVGFDWDPSTNYLWFTDNGRDNMEPNHYDRPPDELNCATNKGQHFGFPYCYGKNISDSQYYNGSCAGNDSMVGAAQELDAHAAAIGMRFYTGKSFPEKYRSNTVFIAEHGSWNRRPPNGYRVSTVTIKDGVGIEYKPFLEGWLTSTPKNCSKDSDCTMSVCINDSMPTGFCGGWGRPADIEVLSDGSILISDETYGVIWRVSYPTSRWGWEVYVLISISIVIIVVILIFIVLISTRNKNYEEV